MEPDQTCCRNHTMMKRLPRQFLYGALVLLVVSALFPVCSRDSYSYNCRLCAAYHTRTVNSLFGIPFWRSRTAPMPTPETALYDRFIAQPHEHQ